MEERRFHIKWHFQTLEHALQDTENKKCVYMCIVENPSFAGTASAQKDRYGTDYLCVEDLYNFYEVVYIGVTAKGVAGRFVGQTHSNILALFRDVVFENLYIATSEIEETFTDHDLASIESILISKVKPRLNSTAILKDIGDERISILNTFPTPYELYFVPGAVRSVITGMDVVCGGVCEKCGINLPNESLSKYIFATGLCSKCSDKRF